MIHHVSLPAHDPERVARVLCELTGGSAVPFEGAGGFLVMVGDGVGTAIEVVADTLRMEPGEDEQQVRLRHREAMAGTGPFHMLLSVAVAREAVVAIGEREGWRVKPFWRGSNGSRDFELIELWLENRLMLEVLTPEMVPGYTAHMRPEALLK